MKKNEWIIFFFLLCLGISARMYYAHQKGYFHIDEIWSFQIINVSHELTFQRADFFNSWHDGRYFFKDLSIERGELFRFLQIAGNTAKDVHPPFYYWLLHIFVAAVSLGKLSIWGGILLNLFLFSLSLIFFIKICRIFNLTPYLLCVTGFIWVMSIAAVSNSLLIRMYELLTAICLVMTYLVCRYTEQRSRHNPTLVLIGGICFLGGMTHYYFYIFLSFLLMSSAIFFYSTGESSKNLALIKSSVLGCAVAVILFPWTIQHLLFSARGMQALESMFSAIELWNRLVAFLRIVDRTLFWKLGLPVCILAAGFAFWTWYSSRDLFSQKRKKMILLFLPAAGYIVVISKIAPYISLRYIQPVLPLISIIFCFFLFSNRMLGEKYKHTGGVIGLMAVLLCLTTLIKGPVENLYQAEQKRWEQFNQDNKIPVAYLVTDPYHWRLIPEFPLMAKQSAVIYFNVENDPSLDARSALSLKNMSKGLYLLVSKYKTNQKKMVQRFMDKNGFSAYTFITDSDYCSVYYLDD